ncbi:3-keto-disaccharide hydrolase [Catenovulum adriaticum]|uniref:DUF1080 domain-containing protein n=1 Tax=Catenovulum adriaticum TaxID=2984846 RepID=A0ABY7ALH3_9ALTE|nr:DUF1080 domain-containing protein [Catenovulum sp. TS8]WAJ69199.1 DUF1080 domain-containing protein [Catenovulum sp. TS8]
MFKIKWAVINSALLLSLVSCVQLDQVEQVEQEVVKTDQTDNQKGEWISLFNGKDLSGWHIKFTDHPLDENYLDTFGVKDGKLIVSYDNYQNFDDKFGHIFYQKPFSSYILKLEYRFIGEQVNGGPEWAYRNNGIMFHSQSPSSMAIEQSFPRSIEVQLLGGTQGQTRTTGNVCTPETNIVVNGQLRTEHCILSTSKTYPGDQWVQAEIEVHGGEKVIHRINGEVVFEYQKTQYEPKSEYALGLSDLIIDEGYIALQAESHPTEFRNIMIKPLD